MAWWHRITAELSVHLKADRAGGRGAGEAGERVQEKKELKELRPRASVNEGKGPRVNLPPHPTAFLVPMRRPSDCKLAYLPTAPRGISTYKDSVTGSRWPQVRG